MLWFYVLLLFMPFLHVSLFEFFFNKYHHVYEVHIYISHFFIFSHLDK